MKITFREAFIKQLQENLQSINGIFPSNVSFHRDFSAAIVDTVEKNTHKRITAKSPNWQFSRLVAALNRSLSTSSGQLDDVLRDIVWRSRTAAGNEIRGIEASTNEDERSSAILLGRDFSKLVDVLKNFVPKESNPARPSTKLFQLEFGTNGNGSGIVKGYACNGFMIAEHEIPCALFGKPFRVYIDIPRLKPKKDDRVEISLEGEYAHVSFGDVVFKTRQPNGPMDLTETRKNIPLAGEKKTIFLNPQYLKVVAAAMCAAAGRGERLEITVRGTSEMVAFQIDGTEALLCPMHPPKGYYEAIAQEQEAKAETKAG